MNYDQKINSAKNLITTHNENADKKIEFEDFISKLRESGGTSIEALRQCSYEDLEVCGLPRLLAKTVAQIFRQSNGESKTKSAYISRAKASMMTPKELLERYNYKDPNNEVGRRLKSIVDNKKCIVFDSDNKVDIEASATLIDEIMEGLPEVSVCTVGDKPSDVYRIGEKPDSYADINPIYPTRFLRKNGVCDQTGRSWESVSLIVRQLLYVAITETNELEISNIDKAHNVMDMAIREDAEKTIRQRYKRASIKYDELVKIGKLPHLKKKINGSDDSNNNPFGKNKVY